jgi:hypothetical protein
MLSFSLINPWRHNVDNIDAGKATEIVTLSEAKDL